MQWALLLQQRSADYSICGLDMRLSHEPFHICAWYEVNERCCLRTDARLSVRRSDRVQPSIVGCSIDATAAEKRNVAYKSGHLSGLRLSSSPCFLFTFSCLDNSVALLCAWGHSCSVQVVYFHCRRCRLTLRGVLSPVKLGACAK